MTFVDALLIVAAVLLAVGWIALDRLASRWFWTTRASKHRFGLVGLFIDRLRGKPPSP